MEERKAGRKRGRGKKGRKEVGKEGSIMIEFTAIQLRVVSANGTPADVKMYTGLAE